MRMVIAVGSGVCEDQAGCLDHFWSATPAVGGGEDGDVVGVGRVRDQAGRLDHLHLHFFGLVLGLRLRIFRFRYQQGSE